MLHLYTALAEKERRLGSRANNDGTAGEKKDRCKAWPLGLAAELQSARQLSRRAMAAAPLPGPETVSRVF
jgi:hypothetical protein